MPQNVTLLKMKLNDIKALSSRRLGFQTNITRPYKLNDFKPAYGLIFSDILNTYDFWGHGDIDLVYGNIKKFITPDILFNYDVINCRHDYTVGCFCLYRNHSIVNNPFQQSGDFKQVFTTDLNYFFDDLSYMHAEVREGYSIFDYPDCIQSMTYGVKKAASEKTTSPYFDFIVIEGTPRNIRWQNRELFAQCEKIKEMSEGCKKMNVIGTHTLFINRYQLPDAYSIEDLPYFLLE
jgi:hypothetical protein